MESKKNIVIGGTGFIGSALVQKLVHRGEKVLSISRHIPEEKVLGVEYVALDTESEMEKLKSVLGSGNAVFLLTGQNYAGFDSEKEKKIFETILNAVKESVPEKVLFTSSALVYGNCEVSASEEYRRDPQDAYSAFKAECEQLIQEQLIDIPVGILRLANVYGSEKNKGFIGLVFKKALAGEGIKVNGDGMQERDYIFLDDVVSAMIAIKEKLQQTDIINISSGESKTLLDVIRTIASVSKKNIPYEVTGIAPQEVEKSRISNVKLQERYGYIPQVFLSDGIKKTWEQYFPKKSELKLSAQ